MIVGENQVLELLGRAERIFLLEPPYKRKYLPLGLAKIASYCKGKDITYGREYQGEYVDLICCTSLFTYDSGKVIDSLRTARFLTDVPILVGGVYASLMPKHLDAQVEGLAIFTGYSKVLDGWVPDYFLPWGMKEPWDDYSYVFTARGCPNQCPYCAVWRIEPVRWVNPNWKDHILESKGHVMIPDNNLTASPHLYSVIDHLAALGKRVTLDNGVDCKYVTGEFAERVAALKFARQGMRLAFDRIEEDGVFQKAVLTLLDAGVSKYDLMAYVLFNFQDTPREADHRARECHRLGIRPYPQRYTPLHYTSRERVYVGRHWTLNLTKAFRYFWLMGGLYQHATFGEFIKSKQWSAHFHLTDEDYAAWGK